MVFGEENNVSIDLHKNSEWQSIGNGDDKIFDNISFIKDQEFMKLPVSFQRFILGYSLRDRKGFTLRDCCKFAFNDWDTTRDKAFSVQATILRRHPKIMPFLEQLDMARVEAMGFAVSRILEEENAIAYSDMTNYLDDDGFYTGNLKDLPGPVRRAIKSFEVVETGEVRKYKLSLWDKGQALNRMQKIKGMHNENVHVKSENVNIDISKDMDPVEASRAYSELMKGMNK